MAKKELDTFSPSVKAEMFGLMAVGLWESQSYSLEKHLSEIASDFGFCGEMMWT